MNANRAEKAASRRREVFSRWVIAAALALCSAAAGAGITLVDDSGRKLTLQRPAQRIISLTPHLTELLFAAGAGGQVVGTVEYSNYPAAAERIPRVGDSAQLDLERIVALKPDLIVVWKNGNAQRQLDKLLRLGIPVFYNEPRRLADIARSVEQLGRLAGTEAVAAPAARGFMARAADLQLRHAGRAPVTVLFQIWDQPLMTVNGDHLISDVIRLCGGNNVFADLNALTPEISTEAVLTADPEAIVGVSGEAGQLDALERWKNWPRMTATARGNLFFIHSDLISRNTPRVLDAAEQLCRHFEAARAKRK